MNFLDLGETPLLWVIGAIAGSLMAGFGGYLVPPLVQGLAIAVCVATGGLAWLGLTATTPYQWQLLDSFGVTLQLDPLGGYFLLTNALVTLAVVLYCWGSGRSAFFYAQLIILQTSVNATFLCSDLISLYVALEVVGIAVFLVLTYPRQPRIIWLGLRYLLISNTAMLFYLLGTILVYQSSQSFRYDSLTQAPPEAIALLLVGLLTKGGIFLAGLWLPQTHGEAATPVSALLSGVVVKVGVLPLLRFAALSETLLFIIQGLGVATALLGVIYAMFAKDSKRMLAFSTTSQMGFVLASPAVGGLYALSHGLVKSSLFLLAGNLPSRSFKQLKQMAIAWPFWVALLLASSSIAGLPLLMGFGAKTLILKNLDMWLFIGLNIAAVGTAVSFSKFVFLKPDWRDAKWPAELSVPLLILLGGLALGNGFYPEAFATPKILKAIATCVLGAALYWGVVKRFPLKLPQVLEKLDHLVGLMTLLLTGLLGWMLA